MASIWKRGGKTNRHGYYYATWIDHSGNPRTRCTKTTDKSDADRIGNKWEGDAALRREGVVDPSQDRFAEQRRRPLSEHVADYVETLKSKGRDGDYINQTKAELNWLIAKCNFGYLPDITSSAVLQGLSTLTETGRSSRTWNSYLRSIKSFTRWLVNDRRTLENQLLSLQKRNEETDRRHVRREITPAEFEQLLRSTESYSHHAHALTGPDRAMLYRISAGTGFRANELRSLEPASFNLDSNPPTVTVAAGYSKRRTNDVQPIAPRLADFLRPWLSGRPQRRRIFKAMPQGTSRMIQHDLDHARQAWIDAAADKKERKSREESDFLVYRDDADTVFDFHGLRHLYISAIVNSGASVKVAQELARHSTPTLTIGRYAHTRLHDLKGALASAPCPDRIPSDAAELRATGTDDAQRHAQCSAQKTPVRGCQDGSTGDNETTIVELCPDNRNTLDSMTLDDTIQGVTSFSRRVSELASSLTRNQVPRKGLGVRIPCPPLS
jgi:integrase